MPLKFFDQTNCFNDRSKPSVVNIEADGCINFSVEAVKQLRLEEKKRITFMIDTKMYGTIYFFQSDNGLLLQVSARTKSGIRLSLFCRKAAKELLQHFGYTGSKSFLLDNFKTEFAGQKMWVIRKSKPYEKKKHATNH